MALPAGYASVMRERDDASRRERNKQKAKAWRVEQRAREEAAMPLSKPDLTALLDHLDRTLFEDRDGTTWCLCDHTCRHAFELLASRGLDVAAILRWCEEFGGFCDCQIASNVGSAWRDRLGS